MILMIDSLEICQRKRSWADLGTRLVNAGRTVENHKNIYHGI